MYVCVCVYMQICILVMCVNICLDSFSRAEDGELGYGAHTHVHLNEWLHIHTYTCTHICT